MTDLVTWLTIQTPNFIRFGWTFIPVLFLSIIAGFIGKMKMNGKFWSLMIINFIWSVIFVFIINSMVR